MNIRKIQLFLLAVVISIPALAVAETMFQQADIDGDGYVSMEEFAGVHPDADKAVFEAADADQNGLLNHAEWSSARQELGYGQGMGQGQGQGLRDGSGQGQGQGKGLGLGPQDGSGPGTGPNNCNQ